MDNAEKHLVLLMGYTQQHLHDPFIYTTGRYGSEDSEGRPLDSLASYVFKFQTPSLNEITKQKTKTHWSSSLQVLRRANSCYS